MSLRSAYDASVRVLRREGVPPDSFGVVREVERYRQFWRPKKGVRRILLAESHARTTEAEFGLRLDSAILGEMGLTGYPSRLVRFVYCLGSGERLLLPQPARVVTSSKWQFFRLLWSCVHDPRSTRFHLTRRATPAFHERLRLKVELLREHQRRGIWLLDASVIGINELSPRVKQEVARIGWERYVSKRILGLNPGPERMAVIGAALAENLFGTDARDGTWSGIPYRVFNQPQGDRTSEAAAETLSSLHRFFRSG